MTKRALNAWAGACRSATAVSWIETRKDKTMNDADVLKVLEETGALLNGHFELRSGLHSNRFFQCANVLRYPRVAGRLCEELVARLKGKLDLGALDGVISPARGGIWWDTRSRVCLIRNASLPKSRKGGW
jgi:hypothetical protein